MDLINKLLDIFVPNFFIHALFSFFPVYACFKICQYILRSIFSENVAGKVVLIAGASSGIGEHLAYEYARRGAYLVLAARREKSLKEVAERAYWLGSPDVITVPTDISKVQDCKRLIQEAINHFGRLDHLVNVAGVTPVTMFEDCSPTEIRNLAPSMDINFWGYVYVTYFAASHLRKTKGKIIVIASSASWLNAPRLSFYSASKAAVISFYETLRVEFASEIGITIVTPGLIESEMTKGKFLTKEGTMVVDQEMRDVVISAVPIETAERCAKAIVDSACRGDEYLMEPFWFLSTFYYKMFFPEVIEWFNRWFFLTEPGTPPGEAISKKILDFPGLKKILYPDSLLSPEIKVD
ncbi:11-beta-hydroxysteroid dehydrogenase 1A [Forsythia ovata]|uniref:11-beta-hydroxysteroid dehydrogenase 1A n=1 Tax=Forsythia ovata TaxID=205694 RepID=A0ABD1R3L5_9LAMI